MQGVAQSVPPFGATLRDLTLSAKRDHMKISRGFNCVGAALALMLSVVIPGESCWRWEFKHD